jgi:hypothetical protein
LGALECRGIEFGIDARPIVAIHERIAKGGRRARVLGVAILAQHTRIHKVSSLTITFGTNDEFRTSGRFEYQKKWREHVSNASTQVQVVSLATTTLS